MELPLPFHPLIPGTAPERPPPPSPWRTSSVNSSRFTSTRTGSVMNLLVISSTSAGSVADTRTTCEPIAEHMGLEGLMSGFGLVDQRDLPGRQGSEPAFFAADSDFEKRLQIRTGDNSQIHYC